MCYSGNTLNTSDDLKVYLATDGCFKTMDTLSAWTEHKVLKYLQYTDRNKKKNHWNHLDHVLMAVWLVMKLNDFIQIYLCNWIQSAYTCLTFSVTFSIYQGFISYGPISSHQCAALQEYATLMDDCGFYAFHSANVPTLALFRPIFFWQLAYSLNPFNLLFVFDYVIFCGEAGNYQSAFR